MMYGRFSVTCCFLPNFLFIKQDKYNSNSSQRACKRDSEPCQWMHNPPKPSLKSRIQKFWNSQSASDHNVVPHFGLNVLFLGDLALQFFYFEQTACDCVCLFNVKEVNNRFIKAIHHLRPQYMLIIPELKGFFGFWIQVSALPGVILICPFSTPLDQVV